MISSRMVRSARGMILAGLWCAGAPGVWAAEAASAVITPQALNGGNFDYTITLSDTGTTNLGTFWFAWIPGQDYLPIQPTATTSPTGWSVDQFTHSGANDGYAIRWVSSSNALTPGSSLTFSFETTEAPSVIAGNSPFFPTTPIGTSFVYGGAPFSDAGARLIATVATPEPPAWALFFLGASGMAWCARRARLKAVPA